MFHTKVDDHVAVQVLWGCAEGYSPVVDAIFADSVPTGAITALVHRGTAPWM